MSEMPDITVPAVFKSLGIEPRPEWTWAVGDRMQKMYAAERGEQPPKALRRKTSGVGTHCLAVYPYDWHQKIADVIRVVAREAEAQPQLFDE
ncbi:MAG: hypothetical protein MUC88_29265 [Planctomycetes bacterium]|nr:hypothetical protein [Planctomycetota bacterium]